MSQKIEFAAEECSEMVYLSFPQFGGFAAYCAGYTSLLRATFMSHSGCMCGLTAQACGRFCEFTEVKVSFFN